MTRRKTSVMRQPTSSPKRTSRSFFRTDLRRGFISLFSGFLSIKLQTLLTFFTTETQRSHRDSRRKLCDPLCLLCASVVNPRFITHFDKRSNTTSPTGIAQESDATTLFSRQVVWFADG